MPFLQKSPVVRDFCLPPWVNLLHTKPADSFAIQPVAPIGAGPLKTQPITASLLPCPQDQFSQLLQPQLIKTTAELQIIYCMYYTQRHKLEGFQKCITLSRQFFLHPQYSSGNDSPSPHHFCYTAKFFRLRRNFWVDLAGKCLTELATLQVEEGAWVHMEHELGGVRQQTQLGGIRVKTFSNFFKNLQEVLAAQSSIRKIILFVHLWVVEETFI